MVVFVRCGCFDKDLSVAWAASPGGVQGDGLERSELREPEATERAERKPVPLHGRAAGVGSHTLV